MFSSVKCFSEKTKNKKREGVWQTDLLHSRKRPRKYEGGRRAADSGNEDGGAWGSEKLSLSAISLTIDSMNFDSYLQTHIHTN